MGREVMAPMNVFFFTLFLSFSSCKVINQSPLLFPLSLYMFIICTYFTLFLPVVRCLLLRKCRLRLPLKVPSTKETYQFPIITHFPQKLLWSVIGTNISQTAYRNHSFSSPNLHHSVPSTQQSSPNLLLKTHFPYTLTPFCSLANLVCSFDPKQSSGNHGQHSNFALFSDKHFSNYGESRLSGVDSFKNYSNGLNSIADSFIRYSRDSTGHSEIFTNYGNDGNVANATFGNYGSAATGGSGTFQNYDNRVNVPGLRFTTYTSDGNNHKLSFSSYSDETNVGAQVFTSYGKKGNRVSSEFIKYSGDSNVIESTFTGYGELGRGQMILSQIMAAQGTTLTTTSRVMALVQTLLLIASRAIGMEPTLVRIHFNLMPRIQNQGKRVLQIMEKHLTLEMILSEIMAKGRRAKPILDSKAIVSVDHSRFTVIRASPLLVTVTQVIFLVTVAFLQIRDGWNQASFSGNPSWSKEMLWWCQTWWTRCRKDHFYPWQSFLNYHSQPQVWPSSSKFSRRRTTQPWSACFWTRWPSARGYLAAVRPNDALVQLRAWSTLKFPSWVTIKVVKIEILTRIGKGSEKSDCKIGS